MEKFVLVDRKPAHSDQYLHYSCHHQTNCKENAVFPCLIEHIPSSQIKMT